MSMICGSESIEESLYECLFDVFFIHFSTGEPSCSGRNFFHTDIYYFPYDLAYESTSSM